MPEDMLDLRNCASIVYWSPIHGGAILFTIKGMANLLSVVREVEVGAGAQPPPQKREGRGLATMPEASDGLFRILFLF